MPHVLCRASPRQETEDFLIGCVTSSTTCWRSAAKAATKPLEHGRTVNGSALELVQQINDLNHGKYLETLLDADPMGFSIGVAAIPKNTSRRRTCSPRRAG